MTAGGQLPQPGGEQRSQTKFIVFENFEKMNTQSGRVSLPEKELALLLNLQPIAPNRLQVVPAPGNQVTTLGANAVTAFFASIGGIDVLVIFTTDGACWIYNITQNAVGQLRPPGSFTNPDVTTWQATRVLINDPTAGYCTWDGGLFVGQGGVSPNITVTNGGSGYSPTSPPTVTISGGSGSGATAVAVVNNSGVITGITLTNPGQGYQAGDTLTVTIGSSPGSGASGHVTMTGFPIASLSLIYPGHILAASGTYSLVFTGGGGSGAAGFVVVGIGLTVIGITLTSQGSGYTSTPTVSVSGLSTGPGGALPIINANLGTESVATIVLDAGGTGYLSAPAVTISPSNGLGSGAAATATLSGTSVNALALNASAVTSLFLAVQGVSTSAPGIYNLSFSGGGGSSAAGTATIGSYTNNTGGTSVGVISVAITNGGSGYTSAPTVTVSGATFTSNPRILAFTASQGTGYTLTPSVFIGSGTSAAASAHIWPYVPKGNTLAVFQGRVWLNGLNTVSNEFNLLQWTGTGASYGNVGYDDFLAADASGSLILSDADLVHSITALRSLNNYLFIMGDQSVKQIGNISLNAAGNVTLFSILTLSSDQGTIYPKSCISFNRIFMFANRNGVFGVFGSSVQKLSSDMDQIFTNGSFTQIPQGGVVDLNDIHYAVFLLVSTTAAGGPQSYILAFDGKRWFLMQQGTALTTLVTVPSTQSGNNTLFGSSGTDITPLLAARGNPVNFYVQTALTHHGNAAQSKRVMRAGFTFAGNASTTVTMTVDSELGNGTALTMNVPGAVALIGGSQSNDNPQLPITNSGIYLGMSVKGSLSGGVWLTNVIIEYQESQLWKPPLL